MSLPNMPCMKDGNGSCGLSIVNNQSVPVVDPSHPEYMGLIECAKVWRCSRVPAPHGNRTYH